MEKTKQNKPKILYLDDEKANLTSFKYLFKPNYEIFLADSAEEGYKLLEQNEVDVVISDQRMPGTSGVEFFEKISAENPDQIRILLTAYSDLEAIIQAVNKGQIYRYLKKPFDPKELALEINNAVELYNLKKENKVLFQYLKSTNEKLILTTEKLISASQKLEQELIEKSRQEQELKENAILLQEQASLLDKATDAIMVINHENNISFWNESAEKVYGWPREEVLGKKMTALFSPDNLEIINNAKISTLQKGEWSGELNQLKKSGQQITVQSRWSLVQSAADKSRTMLIIDTDITERKKLEEQFRHSQRLESIGVLAGGIAHEINNIFTPILVSARYIQNKLTDNTSKLMVETIRTSVQRGAEIVKQILIFSRVEEGKLTKINIIELINEVKKIIKQTFPRNIQIELKVPKSTWEINGNLTQLHQVLLNICLNARDAMNIGGTLTIEAKNVVPDQAISKLNSLNTGRYVEITISDTGTGIPENISDKIFDPFFTTKEPGKGTGLGLATSLSIIKKHDGQLNVSSIPGKGTVFTIYLPESNTRPAIKAKSRKEILRGKGETIQIVDDEYQIRGIVREILEENGYSVLSSENGSMAIKDYQEYKNKVNVVLMDLNMPVMDGNTAARELHKINRKLPIIISSGFHDGTLFTNNRSSEEAEDNITFLEKPYTSEKLLEILAKVLKNPD
jgi:two-component system cell cycle sensor histidine kinase/response regulator CckA